MEIGKVGIIGTGTMARGIAQLVTQNRIVVEIVGRSESSLLHAREAIEKELSFSVRRRQLEQGEEHTMLSLINFSSDYCNLSGCNLLIESVVEDLEIKRNVLRDAAQYIGRSTIVVTNTSALSVSEISEAVDDRSRFLGLHFMNPAPAVNLVEIVPVATTSASIIEEVKEFCKAIGRQFVVVADESGFIVNRLLMVMINEAARMMAGGIASPQAIDKAMCLACGHPMGPVALADFIGLDTVCAELKEIAATFGKGYEPDQLLLNLVEDGHLGRKTGKGLSNYPGK